MDEYIEVASDPELEVIILSSYMQVWMLEKKNLSWPTLMVHVTLTCEFETYLD